MAKKYHVKLVDMQIITFPDAQRENRQVILPYGLGDDGNIYEFAGGSWLQLPPVTDGTMKRVEIEKH